MLYYTHNMDAVYSLLLLVIVIVIAIVIAQKLGIIYVASVFGSGYNPDLPKDINIKILAKLPIKDLEKQKRVDKELNSLFNDDYWRPAMKLAWLREHGFVKPGEDIDTIHYDIEAEIERYTGENAEVWSSLTDTTYIYFDDPRDSIANLADRDFHIQHYNLHRDVLRLDSQQISEYAPLEYIMSHPDTGFPNVKWDMKFIELNKNVTLDFMKKHPNIHGMSWTPLWFRNPHITLKDVNELNWTLHGVTADVSQFPSKYHDYQYNKHRDDFTLEDLKKAIEILELTPDKFIEYRFTILVTILSHNIKYLAPGGYDAIIKFLVDNNLKLRYRELAEIYRAAPGFLSKAMEADLVIFDR